MSAILDRLRAMVRRRRSSGWALGLKEDEVHVLPVCDLIDHTDADCVCGTKTDPYPRDDGSMAWVITHYSLDGRERSEARP